MFTFINLPKELSVKYFLMMFVFFCVIIPSSIISFVNYAQAATNEQTIKSITGTPYSQNIGGKNFVVLKTNDGKDVYIGRFDELPENFVTFINNSIDKKNILECTGKLQEGIFISFDLKDRVNCKIITSLPTQKNDNYSQKSIDLNFTIPVWHSNTSFIQGVCSYQFTFDGQGASFSNIDGISELTMLLDVYDKQRKKIASENIKTEDFADSDANRMGISYWEGDCDADSFAIRKANAIINNTNVDLIKNDILTIEESPLKETIGLKIIK
jgi:hypothetical protein